jgi:AcrR family transcriptional regulator
MPDTNEKKMNRKRAYSQRVIQEAFLELSKTTLISKITVTDICRVADVNRTTFYSNYDDISMLVESIVKELHKKLFAIMSQYDRMDNEEFYIALLNVIKDNATLCLIMPQLSEREFKAMRIDFSLPIRSRNRNVAAPKDGRFNIAMEYIMWGTGLVIVKWLRRGMRPDIPILAKQLCEINDFLMKVNDTNR